MHGMASDANDSCANAGNDCAHDGEVVASVIASVEENVHPVCGSRVVFGILNQSSVLVEHPLRTVRRLGWGWGCGLKGRYRVSFDE